MVCSRVAARNRNAAAALSGFIFAQSPMGVKPVLQSLILADHIYQDAATGKKIIAGTFNKLFFRRQDASSEQKHVVDESTGEKRVLVQGGMQLGSPYAYVSLTEVRGEVKCALRYVDLEEDRPLLQCEFQIDSNDPLQTIEIILPLPPLPTGKAGIHSLELICNDEPIGSLRVHVEELKDATDS